MMKILSLILVMAASLSAGQSLSSGSVSNTSFPNRSKSLPYRVEFYLHDWPASPCGNCRPFRADSIGFDSYFTPVPNAGTFLIVYSTWDTGGTTFNVPLSAFPSKRMYVRFQRDPDAKTHHLEAWDETGKRVIALSGKYTGSNTSTGTAVEASGAGSPISFARIHSTLVPLNSRPPVHRDDSDRLLEWKFDGNRNDSSGNGYNGSGSVSYMTTADQKVYSIIRANPRTWSNWTSLRAGYPQSLIGLGSYSQADDSAEVTYKWSFKSGPRRAIIDDETLATPTVTGLVFGSYVFGLEVKATNGETSYSEQEIGAVAMDDQGIVIPANPDAEKLFGPMIAFGKNPWAFADDAHLRGMKLRSKGYDAVSPPEWKQYLPGTIDYDVTALAPSAATAEALTSTSTVITVANTTNLALTNFPTIVSLGLPGYGGEEVLICSATGNVLSVCFDGRGWRNSNPRSWSSGQTIYQHQVSGTNTAFLTDVCPAGFGLEGPVRYQAGTVTVTPGSAILTGINTAWTSSNNVFTNLTVRIEGTHSGIPFVFFSPIAAINSPTQITLARIFPATADAGTLSYKLILNGYNNFSPLWTRPDGSQGQTILSISGCVDNTHLYWAGGYEAVTGVNTGKNYGLMRSFWMTSGGNGTVNFYDEVLANYALWIRSGYAPARDAARKIGDYWLSQPLLDEGWASNFPRNISAAGTVAGAVLDGRTQNWYALRKLAERGVNAISANCNEDVRENGYQLMWLAFAAMFDPLDTGSPVTPGQRSYWKAKLADAYTRDNNCKQSDNSFSSGAYFNFYGATGTLTNGSTAVVGSGYTAAMCNRIAGGTATVTSNLDTLTSTSVIPAGGQTILIEGMRNGQRYTAKFQYQGSGATIRLSALWPGDSGTVNWQTESDENLSSFSPNNIDSPEFGKLYGCAYNSPTSLTLSRPWEGPSGTAYFYRGNLVGKGQQPFIAGIKTLQLKFASIGASGQTASDYAALAAKLANWIRNTGYDPATGGLHYGRVFSMCEPLFTASRPGFSYRNVGCSFGLGPDDKGAARALLAEAQNAVRVVYEAEPSPANREWGDTAYANQWGISGFTDASVPLSEGNLGNVYASDQSLNVGKWYGFQFGVGMAHQWPAVRLGGAQPPVFEDLVIDYDATAYPQADSVVMTVHRPSGEVFTSTCGTQNCAIQVDRRQGAHWYKLDYRKSNGDSVASGDWQLFYLP